MAQFEPNRYPYHKDDLTIIVNNLLRIENLCEFYGLILESISGVNISFRLWGKDRCPNQIIRYDNAGT